MNKKLKWLCLTPILLAAASGLTSCSDTDGYLILRVINSEDYIYLHDEKDPESAEDLTIQFEKSDLVKEFLEANYPQYKGVKVIYDTSDTNETLYSELQTGKSNYDLMNVSDYMAQKIVSQKMAVPLYRDADGNVDYDMIPNYQQFASGSIKERLDQISAVQKTYDAETNHLDEETVYLKDYAVGYMWGTLGILFNPNYPSFVASGYSAEEVIADMQSYDTLWNPKYKGTISIKNSMRDTYALGVLYTYRDDFIRIKNQLADGQDEQGNPYGIEDYQEDFAEYFNRCEPDQVNEVRQSLEELKNNIFGLEVDSGKQDIITKKIGVNLAWSGDAVYSMDQGEDLNQVREEVELCYSVPENGSNLWFDAWIMPDCPRSRAQYELAHLFLDFLSDPENAVQNMNYTGYTSFIGGDSILELVRDWYDCRTDEIYQEIESVVNGKYVTDYYQVYSVSGDEFAALDYPDCMSITHDGTRNDDLLYYFVPNDEKEEPETAEDLTSSPQGKKVYLTDDEGEYVLDAGNNKIQKKYGDVAIADTLAASGDVDAVDLSYFFDDTLYTDPVEKLGQEAVDEIIANGEDPNDYLYGDEDKIFYANNYFIKLLDENGDPMEDEDGNPINNISVGRQFFCQYPSKETLVRCAVMSDYGSNNTYVMNMWENFKSDPLPTWAIITFAVSGTGVIAFIAYLVINNVLKKQTKKKRIQNS